MDDRLLGTWRSNRELTLKYWRFEPGISQEDKKQLAQMLGKTTWRFTRSQFSFQLDRSRFTKPYTVVAKDAISTVIAIGEKDEPSTLQYIRFEQDYFYILTATHNLEFFSRAGA